MASRDTFNTLCNSCSKIIDTIREVGWHQSMILQASLTTLTASAETGCGVCSELLEHLHDSTFQQDPAFWGKVFPINCECDTSSAIWQSSFEMTLTSDAVDHLRLKFIFEAVEDLQDTENQYSLTPDTGSEECQQLISRWIDRCKSNHSRCNAIVAQHWTPARLLDVGTLQDDHIRLTVGDSIESNLPYATLSHCWGSRIDSLHLTTTKNIEQHKRGIRITDMTKTFRDAVKVTRSLGLRYLWIDSLCIVQDSVEDWSHESEVMSEIYRCGYINIAATGAAEGSEGCFWKRDVRAVRSTEVIIPWHQGSKINKTRRYQVVVEPKLWVQRLVDEPLNTRGWVFQERILSPRVLHFGHQQLFWECRELVACETYRLGLPSCLREDTLIDIKTLNLGDEIKDRRWPAKYTSRNQEGSTTMLGWLWNSIVNAFRPITLQETTLYSDIGSASAYRDWDAVVELYSSGALTFPKDKLVAFSGLARALSQHKSTEPEDGYLAGLWQSSLPSHLLWVTRTVQLKRGRTQKILVPSRYPQYIAPSWSWASVEGKISFMWCQRNFETKEYLATMEHAEVKWSSRSRFGQVDSGIVTISGPVASILWQIDDDPTDTVPMAGKITHVFPPHLDQGASVAVVPDDLAETEIFFDEVDDMPRQLTLLPVVGVSRRAAFKNDLVIGLVLTQKVDAHIYVRVGFFCTTRSRLVRILKNMPRCSVSIE